jgi:predicted nucleic acid-binding protein
MHYSKAREYVARLDTSLRTFDALHLAIAHANKCTLVTADKQLATAAAMLEVEHYFVSFS